MGLETLSYTITDRYEGELNVFHAMKWIEDGEDGHYIFMCFNTGLECENAFIYTEKI